MTTTRQDAPAPLTRLDLHFASVPGTSLNLAWVLVGGFLVLILADFMLAFATDIPTVAIGVALWGLHMGLTQGLLAALVADTAPVNLRGTAFGMFNLATGLALLVASVLAGALWDRLGPQATFLAGAAFTLLALIGLLPIRRHLTGGITR